MDTSPENLRCVRLVVSGVVQGVGYRYATISQARRLGLLGWVKNNHDGTVEILAEGPAEQIAKLRDWCRVGPPGARVRSVQETEAAPGGRLAGFEMRY